MKLWICIFLFFILLLLTSKLKIKILYLKKEQDSSQIRFHINFGFYVLGGIKVFGISCKEDAIHFLLFKIPYSKMKVDEKMIKEISAWDLLKSLHPQFEQFAFHLKIGSEDVMLTVFLVFAISTFLSILSAKNRKQINQKQYGYEIMPIYGKNTLSFQLSSQISMKILAVFRTVFFVKKFTKNKKKTHLKKILLKI